MITIAHGQLLANQPIVGHVHRVAILFQTLFEGLHGFRLVFNQEQIHIFGKNISRISRQLATRG